MGDDGRELSLVPAATKSAMGTLKRSVHSYHFCHRGRAAPPPDAVAFLTARYGSEPALARLLALRQEYRRSLGFVRACLPAFVRLHWHTARTLELPRP